MPTHEGANRPNILIIMTDQHNKHIAGCYGDEVIRTPNIDRLAGEGARFENAYCAGPLCVPSRMSFMTSQTPSHNRVWDNKHILPSSVPTWAHALGAGGYETALIGRMHFIGPDQRHGFEKRPIGEYHAHHPGVPEKGGPRWIYMTGGASGQSRVAVDTVGVGPTTYQWADDRIADAAVAYVRNREDSRPFAAVVGFNLPHCPFVCPEDLFRSYDGLVQAPPVEDAQPETVERFRRHRGIDDLSPERARLARTAYYGLVEYMDRNVGRILDALDEAGLRDDTLVIYTADHGEMAGEHGCWWKSNYYEGSAGVPLVARFPGHVPEGVAIPEACSLLDIGPTLVDLTEAEPLPATDGRSLLPLLFGTSPSLREDAVFSEFAEAKHTGGTFYPSRMIRRGPWKLWAYEDAAHLPPALFNVDEDPNELRDLASDPAYASTVEELVDELYRDWQPEWVLRECRRNSDAVDLIAKWGRAVRPECEDALEVPPPELEKDIRFF